MKTVKLCLLALIVVLALPVIVACGPTGVQAPPTAAPTEPPAAEATEPPPPTPTAQAAPTEGGPKRGGTVRVGLLTQAKNFDPHKSPNQPEYWTDQLMYDYLVTLDQQLDTQPSLATDWSVSDDGLTWTFELRQGVQFHNGRELTAADVKYSIERILNPETASSLASRLDMVESIEVPDDYTVSLKLSTPNAVLPSTLADPRAAIVAKEIVEENGDLSQAEAGSGPFKFVSLEVDETIVLEHNPDYWQMGADGQPLPYLDRLELMPIPDNSARNTALRTGDVDIITFVTTNFISLLRQESDIVIPENATSAQYYYLLMNNSAEPFNDIKIRQAIAYALDRNTITKIALGGEGYPLLAGNIPPWHWAAIQDPLYPQPDVEKAKQLLAESSLPDGFEFELRVWAAQDYVLRAAQVIQDQLAPLNIKPKIEQQGEWASYWSPVTEGNFEATIQGTGGNTDPDVWTYEPFHTEGGKNYGKYSNSEVDEFLQQGRQESDQEKRKEIYAEVQRIVADEVPMAFLFNMNQTEAWRDYVKGYYHLPTMHIIALKETWLDK